MSRLAFTLLETLAVLVLLGLVAGWALTAVGRSKSPWMIAERFAAIDSRARQLARTEGPQQLVITDITARIEPLSPSRHAREYDIGSRVTLRVGLDTAKHVVFDHLGQSVDYYLIVAEVEEPFLRVHGLTGWSETTAGDTR